MLHIHLAAWTGASTAPASKSDAQRALAAASLARGRSVISGCTPCDDTDAALEVIGALGARVERAGRRRHRRRLAPCAGTTRTIAASRAWRFACSPPSPRFTTATSRSTGTAPCGTGRSA